MMKRKRMLAWLLSVVLLAGMLPAPAFAAEQAPPCEKTVGCALPNGHAGDCETAPPANKTLVKQITGWAFVDGDNLSGGILPLPGVNMDNQADFDTVAGMLPTRIRAELDGETDPATLDITGWTCETFQQEEGNWPVTGTYIFAAEPPGGYVIAPDTAALEVPVMLGGANVLGNTGAFTVTGGTYSDDYTYESNTLIIKSGTELTIANADSNVATTDKIKVDSGVTANITLNGVNIDVSGTSEACALDLSEAGQSTITLVGNSMLKSGRVRPGIYVPQSLQVTISGDGELEVHGGESWPGIGRTGDGDIKIEGGTIRAFGGSNAAGIGGSWGFGGGKITISGGTVNAMGSAAGAGIGGGKSGEGGVIAISGNAVVTATGGDDGYGGGAGIGGGGSSSNSGTIVISGGFIRAEGGSNGAAGIGGGGHGGEMTSLTITGGIIIATGHGRNGNDSDGNANAIGGGAAKEPSTLDNNMNAIIIDGTTKKGNVYGTVHLNDEFTLDSGLTLAIPNGSTLTVLEGATLTNNGTITGNGTLDGEGTFGGEGTYTLKVARSIDAPAQNSVTADSVVLKTVSSPDGGGDVTYGYGTNNDSDQAGNWQSGLSFTGLAPGTDYYFFARVSANGAYQQATSTGTQIQTLVAPIDIKAIPGVTAPARGATPVTEITATDQYTGTVTWSPTIAAGGKFAADTEYTATITLSPTKGYTLDGVTKDFFTVAEASSVSNSANSGEVKAVFPKTAKAPIDIKAIPGVTAPARGASPVAAITATAQYTGTVTWSPAISGGGKFAADTEYTATITLTPKDSYTLVGVTENFFTVEGASPVTNSENSGEVKAVFPKTAKAPIDIQAIPGVTAPVLGASPVAKITATDQYTGKVEWSPEIATGGKFAADTEYTATITLSPTKGYTLDGVAKDFFTVAEASSVSNSANSGEVKAVFPKTAKAPIDIQAIPGVTAPARGATPVTEITATDQYTGTVTWSPTIAAGGKFAADTEYTATITLSPTKGYTLDGVTKDFFTVAEASSVSNSANSGEVKAVFPKTAKAPIDIQAIPGVTAPARGASPVAAITATAQYTGAVVWSPAIATGGTFAADTEYTATITLTPKDSYTLVGVTENFFTVEGASATNDANSGVIAAVFPKTAKIPIDIQDISGVTAPVRGASPVEEITATDQYTGTVAWSPTIAAGGTFAADTVYTATITLTPKDSYTLDGVTENFFTVEGATPVTNSENSGVITAVFPKTAAAVYTIETDKTEITFDSLTEGYETAPAAQTVKISNTGNQEVTITLPSATGYTVTATGAGWSGDTATLAVGGAATFTVQPQTGLTEGEHKVKLTISTDHGASATVDLSFTVTAEPTYSVTVTGGTGGGSYKAGDPVSITATAPSGQRFTGWTISPEVTFTEGDATTETAIFTMPAGAVTVTARFENIPTSGGGRGSSNATYSRRTLTTGGVKVSGSSIYQSAVLTVKAWAFHGAGDAGCDLLRAAQENGRVLGAWDVSLSHGFRGSLTVSLPVEGRNGETLTVAHCVDGKLTLSDVKVAEGFAAVETDSLSPFAVLDGVFTQAELETLTQNPFADVRESDWFYDAVRYVYGRDIMHGAGETTFRPDETTTRAQLAAILWRLEDSPAPAPGAPFADVPAGRYYTDAVAWCAGAGLMDGYGGGRFGPDDPITREQLAAALWRYAKYKGWDVSAGQDTNIGSYPDAALVSGWAIPAVQWACGAGIVNGGTDGRLHPQGEATRAQLAQMLQRLLDK